MSGKSQIETVVEKLRSNFGLDVKPIDGTDCATMTIDALSLSHAEWQAFAQSQAMRNAVDAMRSADEMRARYAMLKRASDMHAYDAAEFHRALVDSTARLFVRTSWPRRSKPARRAMARLAARRGRRG